MTAPMLRVEALSKAFDGVKAIAGVSFAVAPGELVALIGPNGAGKTTCFNLVNGQLAPDEGTVTLGGERIDGLLAARDRPQGCRPHFPGGGDLRVDDGARERAARAARAREWRGEHHGASA